MVKKEVDCGIGLSVNSKITSQNNNKNLYYNHSNEPSVSNSHHLSANSHQLNSNKSNYSSFTSTSTSSSSLPLTDATSYYTEMQNLTQMAAVAAVVSNNPLILSAAVAQQNQNDLTQVYFQNDLGYNNKFPALMNAAQLQQHQQQHHLNVAHSASSSKENNSNTRENNINRETNGSSHSNDTNNNNSTRDNNNNHNGGGNNRANNNGNSSSSSSCSSNTGDVVVVVGEETVRKREMRLLKNREAARECRRKKKEYIKCLENRVSVLEAQNKTLIDELKSLKELYCQSGDGTQNH